MTDFTTGLACRTVSAYLPTVKYDPDMTSDTRERILRISSELFAEQGYEATSLREIADRMGFTKAALYYHFQSKEDILKSLIEPAFEIIGELVDRLEAAEGPEQWADALGWVIDQFYENLDFFRLMDRNRHSFEVVTKAFAATHRHSQMHERVEAAAHAAAANRGEEIRMIAALGAVTGFDDWGPTLLGELPVDLLRSELTAAVRDLLKVPARRRTKATASSA
jgi:AcrR family transcriptional regulator